MDMAVFRAIETRRPVLRATNTGLTAAIDPTGSVTARLQRDTEGALDVVVSLPSPSLPLRPTVRIFGLSCGVALALLLAAALVRRPLDSATFRPEPPARRRARTPKPKSRRRAR